MAIPDICWKYASSIIFAQGVQLYVLIILLSFGMGFSYMLGKRLGFKLGNLIKFKRGKKK